MPSFNLIDEPWLPCLTRTGEQVTLSLREALVRSPELAELVHPSPLVTAALHRLLLAVLHRVFGPEDAAAWGALWERGGWDTAALDAYLDRWRERFDLFHPERPFYQVAGLNPTRAGPVTRLAHELASPGNPVALFDHTLTCAFTAAEAAPYVVAQQAFAVGGLVSHEPGEPPERYKFADAAPLTSAAVAVAKGPTLFHTLSLNLHRYAPEDGEPFEFDRAADLPAWERDSGPQVVERVPDGYLDLLTWQSRRILLLPNDDGRVRSAVVMKGDQFPDYWDPHEKETMVAFIANRRGKSSKPAWLPAGFREGRAAWRDSLTLLESLTEERSRPKRSRPKLLTWLADLVAAGVLPRAAVVPLDLYGMVTDRANVRLWRHERLPLPLQYLEDRELVEGLRKALDLAEEVAGAMAWAVRLAADGLVGARGASGRKDAALVQHLAPDRLYRDRLEQLLQHLAPDRLYWARLEQPFRELAVSLPQDRVEEPDGSVTYGRRELSAWARRVRRTAEEAFTTAIGDLDGSGRALRAATEAEHAFRRRLRALMSPFLEKEGVDEPAQ